MKKDFETLISTFRANDELIDLYNYKLAKLNIEDNDTIQSMFWTGKVYLEQLNKFYPNNKKEIIDEDGTQLAYGVCYNVKETTINNVHYKFINFDNCEEELDMDFDKVIMNPPYENKLHERVLHEVKQHLASDGELITLQPNYLENYKNEYSEDMIPNELEIVDRVKAQKLFDGIQLNNNLAVMKFNSSKKKFNRAKLVPKTYEIFSKLIYEKTLKDVNNLDYDHKGVYVPLKLMTATWDKNKDSIVDKLGVIKDDYTIEDHVYYKDKRNKNVDRVLGGIKFKTIKEAKNFVDSTETTFYKCLVRTMHINSRYVLSEYPFMQDYTQPWTNERFYKYFNITKEEQKIIEDTMKEYE